MTDQLSIRVVATLNTGLSIKEINTAIKAIEKSPSLNRIKLNVQISDQASRQIGELTRQLGTVGNSNTNRGLSGVSTGINNIGQSAQQTQRHTINLGNALQQAFTKFPINFHRWE